MDKQVKFCKWVNTKEIQPVYNECLNKLKQQFYQDNPHELFDRMEEKYKIKIDHGRRLSILKRSKLKREKAEHEAEMERIDKLFEHRGKGMVDFFSKKCLEKYPSIKSGKIIIQKPKPVEKPKEIIYE